MNALSIALALALGAVASTSRASPITYTVTSTASGSLDGTAFTNELLTITTVADTASVVSGTQSGIMPYYRVAAATTFTLGTSSGSITGALGDPSWPSEPGAFSTDLSAVVSPGKITNFITGLGVWQGAGGFSMPLGVWAPSFFDLGSDFTYTGSAYSGGNPITTDLGLLIISATPGTSTFTATLSSSPVPEIDPAGMGSVMALVGSVLGLVERRRRGRA